MKKIILFLFILFFNKAIAIEFDGKFIQGHFIIGKTDPNTNIIIDNATSINGNTRRLS